MRDKLAMTEKEAETLRRDLLSTGNEKLRAAAALLTPERWQMIAARPALLAEIRTDLANWLERYEQSETLRMEIQQEEGR